MSTTQQVATALGSPMSDQEYVAGGGGVCPFCGDSDIRGESLDVEFTTAWQPVRCGSCGKRWNDLYKMIGYEEIT